MRTMALLAVAVCLSIVHGASAFVLTSDVEYTENSTSLLGFQAFDDDVITNKPIVVIVPQWSGLGDYEKKRAHMLAEMGYFAFAADIYGVGALSANSTSTEWGAQVGIYRGDVPLFVRRIEAAVAQAKTHTMVDTSKVVVIGYCFGGTGVLNYAISGADVLGVVSFHGGLTSRSNATLASIPAKVLVLSGGNDDAHSEVGEIEDELTHADATWEITRYGHVVHSFTEWGANSTGAMYDERADMRSWESMKLFLTEVFTGMTPETYTNAVDHTENSTIVKGHVNYTDSHDSSVAPFALTGYHAYDSSLTGPLPIVVVVPTWTGLGEYVMQRVEMLAELGYYAFAADVYGNEFNAETAQSAQWGEYATIYHSDSTLFVARINAGIMKAKEHQWADATKVAAIGYCFGGTGVVNLAITGADVLGVVSFHGGIQPGRRATASAAVAMPAKVLILSGGDDDSQANIALLETEFNAASATWEMARYGHVVHGYTEWEGGGYNSRADMLSWSSMKLFLNELFVSGVVGTIEPSLVPTQPSAGSLSASSPLLILVAAFAAILYGV